MRKFGVLILLAIIFAIVVGLVLPMFGGAVADGIDRTILEQNKGIVCQVSGFWCPPGK